MDNFMTLPRVSEIMNAWPASPPTNWSLSALAGFKPAQKKNEGEQDLRDMFGVVVEEPTRGE